MRSKQPLRAKVLIKKMLACNNVQFVKIRFGGCDAKYMQEWRIRFRRYNVVAWRHHAGAPLKRKKEKLPVCERTSWPLEARLVLTLEWPIRIMKALKPPRLCSAAVKGPTRRLCRTSGGSLFVPPRAAPVAAA